MFQTYEGVESPAIDQADVLYCSEAVTEFSYPRDADSVGIADCSLLENTEEGSIKVAEGDTVEDLVIKDVVQEVFSYTGGDEETVLILDSGEQLPPYDDFEGDYLLLDSQEVT